jgi:hypothetical protein
MPKNQHVVPNGEGWLVRTAGEHEGTHALPQQPDLDVRWPVGEALRQRIVPLAYYIEARKGFSSDAELAAVIGVAPEQLVRWKRGGRVAPESERLMRDLAVVVADLLAVYKPRAIPDWLQGCPPGETKSPLDWLREGNLAEVLSLINASASGAYS